MIPLVGIAFGGRSATERAPQSVGEGVLGQPVWGPHELLRDLELRLALTEPALPFAVRVQTWAQQLIRHAAIASPFYARSFGVDPLGTAQALLAWRDALIEAGWDGATIPNGGSRLDTFAALEQGLTLPLGFADRLRRAEEALIREGDTFYDELWLAESPEVWPGRWRHIFDRLVELGTQVRVQMPVLDGAPADSDLGRVQRALSGNLAEPLVGDGTFLLLRGETSWELADAVGAMLRGAGSSEVVIVRSGEARALDLALATHGLSTQGARESSPWRGTLQLLPLAIELVFSPRDPYRVLDVLTLPGGPFDNLAGRILAEAMASAPGVGGRVWRDAKARVEGLTQNGATRAAVANGLSDEEAETQGRNAATSRLAQIAAWLEAPTFDPIAGAPRESLLEAVDRVRNFLRTRLALAESSSDDRHARAAVLRAAYAQAEAAFLALSHDQRAALDRDAAWQLVSQVTSGGCSVAVTPELAARIDISDTPAGLRRSYEVVLWWHAASGTEWRPGPQPWRQAELEALRAAGIALPDPWKRLAAEATSWRQAILAAKKRVVLAIPHSATGEPVTPHPIWDEITARLAARESDLARVTLHVSDLLVTTTELRAQLAATTDAIRARVEEVPSLPLREPRTLWRIDPSLLVRGESLSASQLDSLIGCPLRWVLERRARLEAGALASIPAGPLLFGRLGHRLVEALHDAGVLGDPDATDRELPAIFDQVVQEEGAPLLRPGETFKLAELTREMSASLRELSSLIQRSKLRVVEVESSVEVAWGKRKLFGRLDLLLTDSNGEELVLDLKWGRRAYEDLLRAGLATQLAVYAAARKLYRGARVLPHAAYFGLGRGVLLATEPGPYAEIRAVSGPTVEETWNRLERTLELAESLLDSGVIPVTGVALTGDSRRLPLLAAASVDSGSEDRYLQVPESHGCTYCGFGAICGRRWEGVA